MFRLFGCFSFISISLSLVVSASAQEIVQKGDFSKTTRSVFSEPVTDSSSVDGAWVVSAKNPWVVRDVGGNLGEYIEVEYKKRSASRLLHVIHNGKRAAGIHTLSFDYHMTDSNDELGVIVFGMNKELSVGGDSGAIQMDKGAAPGMTFVEPSKRWAQHTLPISLGDGFEYVYNLFSGRAQFGQVGLDNVSFLSTP